MAKNPKPFRAWKRRTQRLLGASKPLEGKRLGFAVQVIEPLEVWSYAGGWADGPFTHHSGALLFLTNVHEGRVFYTAGARPAPWSINGGVFPESDLGKVQRIPNATTRAAMREAEAIGRVRLARLNAHGGVDHELFSEAPDVGREVLPSEEG